METYGIQQQPRPNSRLRHPLQVLLAHAYNAPQQKSNEHWCDFWAVPFDLVEKSFSSGARPNIASAMSNIEVGKNESISHPGWASLYEIFGRHHPMAHQIAKIPAMGTVEGLFRLSIMRSWIERTGENVEYGDGVGQWWSSCRTRKDVESAHCICS